MKWFFSVLIFLVFVTPIIFIGKGVDHLDIMKDRYKRALDAGANAAVAYISYDNEHNMAQISAAFGEQSEHANNIEIDKDAALTWFYRVFYRNLRIEDDLMSQERLKEYIPLKAIVAYDRIMIADCDDHWIVNEYYDIEYLGEMYRFTLSDRVMKIRIGQWGKDTDFSIPSNTREALVNEFIKKRLNTFLNNRANSESNYYYDVNIAISDIDLKTDDIDGVNFIVMVEGIPLPNLNPWKREKYYAFGLGGSEITR